ncbi:MAG: Gfo/Idh/MocA family oxidoreductase [Cyanobacteriota bacterium]|nr:Gfo/Idh/MocA family oxidoreductase [Cyanobacteriota bacterium]
MSTTPLRVAIAGLGFGEKVHLEALRSNPNWDPVSLWHPRADRLAQACAAHGLQGSTCFDELLADPSLDAVVIATPPAPRQELARAALEAGKHLMLEKPVALDAAAVADLQRLALSRGLTVAVDFEYRAVPLFQQLANLLQQGVLGDPWLVKLDWLMASRADASRPWSWYSSRELGGGVLGALGTHAFDLLHWLVGPSQSLSAQLSTAIRQRPHPQSGAPTTVDAEDIALIQLQLLGPSGQTVPAQMNLASTTRAGRGCWLEIYGSEATLVLGSDNQADYVHGFGLWMARPGEPLRPVAADPSLAFRRTWGDGRIAPVERLHGWWAEAIRTGSPMVPGLLEAHSSQQCCDQALRQGHGAQAHPQEG